MLTETEAVDLFDRRRRAWLAGDIESYLAMFAPEVSFQSPVHAEPLRGLDAFAALVRGSHANTKPLAFDFHHIAVRGDVVLAEWRIAIEHRESGRRIEWPGMSVCRIEDGRIVQWREYWNPADLA